ncbi:MAG: hypothetical protein M1812_006697 [Candelaria pacifica]|nr:MAG: hypothetical protein M1812_006697 [Candelaria pacifica]
MFTPTYVNLRYWFYPTGNTPAVNLFRELPAPNGEDGGGEPVEALLLACGDPRNVLFSLACELDSARKFDITCCDLEPAVLARNVILFTLIADKKLPADIWNIFYHFFIPDRSLKVLHDQVEKLLLASDPLQAWGESQYGASIQFLNVDTLNQLRKYWALYLGTKSHSPLESQRFERDTRASIAQIYKDKVGDRYANHGTRSAGVAWARGMEFMGRAFKAYWETGVVGGNSVDLQALEDSKGHVNPMFAISSAPSGQFAVHYGTDPLLGFNVTDAFDDKYTTNSVVQAAKARFQGWCGDFSTRLTTKSVLLKLFCGDAIRLCHGLQRKSSSHIDGYLGPWTARPLSLGGLDGTESPLQYYDIIDTSNLIDHVGILNVLTAAAPLLRKEVSSCLYTESLLQATKDITASLQTILCSDLTTISLILGLAPVGHLLGMTMDDISTEALMFTVFSAANEGGQRQYRLRVPWKYPELGDPYDGTLERGINCQSKIIINADQLADLYFAIYKKMFASEDLSTLMASMNQSMRTLVTAYDLRYYNRASFVAVLGLAQGNVQTDWTRFMELLVDEISNDRSLIVGSNSLQEFYMYLHVSGVWRCPTLGRDPRYVGPTLNGQPRPTSNEKGLLARSMLPSMVHVVLVVPRRRLTIFTEESPDTIGTPGLHLSIRQSDPQTGFDNSFFSIHCFFGRVSENSSSTIACSVEEDTRGWNGGADLIVTCPIPTLQLLLGPRKGIQVALTIDTTPATNQFTRKLGIPLDVFATSLDDASRLKILEKAPGLANGASMLLENSSSERKSFNVSSQHTVTVQLDKSFRSTHLQYHADFAKCSEEGKALSTGGVVEMTSIGPCSLRMRIGDTSNSILAFPFPIHGLLAKTRIARKGSWVEVAVPTAAALDQGGFTNPFPVIVQKNRAPVAWSAPRVHLDRQPKVRIRKGHDYSWIEPLINMTRSDQERIETELEPSRRSSNAKRDLKESLHALFLSYVGLNRDYGFIDKFQLCLEGTGGHTLIFATALRHDLDSRSFVLDACVVPLTLPRVRSLSSALARLVAAKPLMINVSPEETVLWKNLLPALAERCRTWKHKSTCEYQMMGAPLSTEIAETPLCSCGEGQVSPDFLQRKDWAPFKKYATQIAISPIFPVPYLSSGSSASKPKRPSPSSTLASAMAAYAAEKCDFCGARSKDTKLCGRCKGARYCDAACQKSAWKEHKKLCKQ